MLQSSQHANTPPPSKQPNLPPSSSSSTSNPTSSSASTSQAQKALAAQGLQVLSEVAAGQTQYFQEIFQPASTFTQPMHDLAVSSCWGSVWSRPGLSRKQRSLVTIAVLATARHPVDLAVRIALNNGASETEIRETLLQTAAYAGIPVGMETTRVAEKAIRQVRTERGDVHREIVGTGDESGEVGGLEGGWTPGDGEGGGFDPRGTKSRMQTGLADGDEGVVIAS